MHNLQQCFSFHCPGICTLCMLVHADSFVKFCPRVLLANTSCFTRICGLHLLHSAKEKTEHVSSLVSSIWIFCSITVGSFCWGCFTLVRILCIFHGLLSLPPAFMFKVHLSPLNAKFLADCALKMVSHSNIPCPCVRVTLLLGCLN